MTRATVDRVLRAYYRAGLIYLALTLEVAAIGAYTACHAPHLQSTPGLPTLTGERPRIKHIPTYHGFIEGGIANLTEFREELNGDAALADQFKDFDFAKAKFVVLEKPECTFVGYRSGNKFAWTKDCRILKAGTLILTDGHYRIRAACGNPISFIPEVPVIESPDEPNSLDIPPIEPSEEGNSSSVPPISIFVPLPPSPPPGTVIPMPPPTAPPIVICCGTVPPTTPPVRVPDHGEYTFGFAAILIAGLLLHKFYRDGKR